MTIHNENDELYIPYAYSQDAVEFSTVGNSNDNDRTSSVPDLSLIDNKESDNFGRSNFVPDLSLIDSDNFGRTSSGDVHNKRYTEGSILMTKSADKKKDSETDQSLFSAKKDSDQENDAKQSSTAQAPAKQRKNRQNKLLSEIPAQKPRKKPAMETITKQDVVRAWNAAEFDQFAMRATCLSPSTTFMDLPLRLKARVWKYMSELMPYYPELPGVMLGCMVLGQGERYMRVKELFESAEVTESLCVCVCMYACMCSYMYVCMYIYMYIYIYIYK